MNGVNKNDSLFSLAKSLITLERKSFAAHIPHFSNHQIKQKSISK